MSIERFLKAQKHDYSTALIELRNGRKESCWMWYIFPQIKGLGMSPMAEYYGIETLDEAREYMANDVLRERLIEVSSVLLSINEDARTILGFPDDLKLRSCMTLFNLAAPEEAVFQKVLDKFFDGKIDERTIELLRN